MDTVDLKSLQSIIELGESRLVPNAMRFWSEIRITPEMWTLPNYQGGDSTWSEDFWVVGIFENNCVWYNHIEEGFNISSFAESGVISEPGYEQYELNEILNQESKKVSP